MTNSISIIHPELVKEWSDRNLPLTPDDISYGSKKEYWWIGSCGHEWIASAKSRSSGENCPYCAGKRVLKGFNDLASKCPYLVKEWSNENESKPSEILFSSHKKALWIDKYGHKWEAIIKNRANGAGCPYCSHNKILIGFNDLGTLCPDVASEWSERNYPLKPTMVTPFSNKKVWWKCKLGHEWNALISTRSYGSKCPYCSNIQLLKGFNDFQTRQPALSEEWSEKNYPLYPDQINEKSRMNVWWKCRKCGNEWKAVVNSRVRGSKCPVCEERSVMPGYNDIITTDPDVISEWDFQKNTKSPSRISRNSMYSYWWKCKYGHSRKSKVFERTVEKKICPECEKEFRALFPQLLISYYAHLNQRKVFLNDERLIGLPLDVIIPEERIAIITSLKNENIVRIQNHLCLAAGIKLIKLQIRKDDDYETIGDKIKGIFKFINIYIKTNTSDDVKYVKERYFDCKK